MTDALKGKGGSVALKLTSLLEWPKIIANDGISFSLPGRNFSITCESSASCGSMSSMGDSGTKVVCRLRSTQGVSTLRSSLGAGEEYMLSSRSGQNLPEKKPSEPSVRGLD